MFGRHGGIASGLFRAAHDLDLRDGQKDTFDAIEVSLKADDEGVRTAMKAFRADLVAGVGVGKLDTAKLTADNVLVDKAIADHQAKEAEALDSLHTLLDATQRATLVASVRTRQAEREARIGGWILAKESDGGAPDWAKKRVDTLTADLGLDAEQQKQSAAIVAKANDPPNAAGMKVRWDDMKKRMDALLAAFAADPFDAKTADLTILPGKTAHDPMDHMATFFSKLLPILHPDQRDKLATELDKPFGFGGGPGMRRGMQGRGPADDIVFPFEEPIDNAADASPGLAR
jgi:Spy/CpxP family protein refolding chaperone